MSEAPGDVYEMQIPVMKLQKKPNKKTRMLWRYAAGSALNAENKARRKEANKNIKTLIGKVEQVQSTKNNSANSPKSKSSLKKKRPVDFDLNRNSSPSGSSTYPRNNEDVNNHNIVGDKLTNQSDVNRRNDLLQSGSGVYTVPTLDRRHYSSGSNKVHDWENGHAGNGRPQNLPVKRRKDIKEVTLNSPSDNRQDSSSTSGVSRDAYYHLDDDNIYGTPSVYI